MAVVLHMNIIAPPTSIYHYTDVVDMHIHVHMKAHLSKYQKSSFLQVV